MKKIFYKKAFTLVELIVAIAITSLVLVSIVEIFLFSSNFSRKVDISRVMQENVKNFTEIISEDVRINGIKNLPTSGLYEESEVLKTGSGTSYYLAKKTESGYSDSDLDCKSYKPKDRCILVRKKDGNIQSLVNSWIAFEDLKFYTSSGTIDGNNGIPKVTMTFIIRPATKKGLSVDKIKKSKIIGQTTFSERLYNYK